MQRLTMGTAALCLAGAWALADVATVEVTPARTPAGQLTVAEGKAKDAWTIGLALPGVPKGAKILRAVLYAGRTQPLTGREDWAMQDIVIRPDLSMIGDIPAPLRLLPPRYDGFDATAVVRDHLKEPGQTRGFSVDVFPKFDPKAVRLLVEYEGKTTDPPAQPKGLKVVHRGGQTFITWAETHPLIEAKTVTYGRLKELAAAMDAKHRVRYRVYRHTAPITAKTLAQAQWLADADPLSAYNVDGRSVDELIAIVRRRAIDDLDLAKRLAKTRYFRNYHPNMSQMSEVAIGRLAIEHGKPLPIGTGLYVHHPAKAGKAYYAVVASVNGRANGRDFSAANSLQKPVTEAPGVGEPIAQGRPDVTVFYDYPGTRTRYVQWGGPAMANLPGAYFNLGVFVPRDYAEAKIKRLSLFCHDSNQRYLKCPWPHRSDTVLVAVHDYPYRSYGYGYHEALGTLRSFKQGRVRPFFAHRMDAVLAWALRTFRPDAGRVSVGGSGYWGGTAALQYGLRRGGKIAYVLSDGSPDPAPKDTPDKYVVYPWRKGRPVPTPRGDIDAVWGKPAWACKAESGKSIWDETDLVAFARSAKDPLPFMSLGAGAMAVTWPQQVGLMKAFMASRNAFMSEFYWGGSAHMPVPPPIGGRELPFEPRADKPFLACRPTAFGLNKGFDEKYWVPAARGYGSGGRACVRPRWNPEDIMDTPERLEMTIYSARTISYRGSITVETTIRNARNFKPAAGEKLTWSLTPLDKASRVKPQGGQIAATDRGMIIIEQLRFSAPARLVVVRAQDK